ncbi:MAG: hypothetical protein ACE149_15285 [Armatimonadota bacterium]
MRAGDTFRLNEPTIRKKHVWVIISGPLLDTADPVVIVNLTTHRPGKTNPTCVLGPEDHPLIRHPTAVRYEDAVSVPNAGLESSANRGELVLQGQLRPDVLDRIRQGAAQLSSRLPEEAREILRKQGLIE